MRFDSFSDFLSMGGDGLYVWLSYGIGVVVILGNVVWPILRRKQLLTQLRRRLRREENKA